jgi:hypothetical protein
MLCGRAENKQKYAYDVRDRDVRRLHCFQEEARRLLWWSTPYGSIEKRKAIEQEDMFNCRSRLRLLLPGWCDFQWLTLSKGKMKTGDPG